MDQTRRKMFQAALFGAGSMGLRAFATGLPLGFFRPGVARADVPAPPDAGAACNRPQYLVFSTSNAGDPLNANVPGAYVSGTYRSSDPSMASTSMSLGGATVTGAKVWAGLDQNILNRTCFFHHASKTNSHGDGAKVNRLQGAVQRSEMLVSLLAKNTNTCLGAGGDAGMGGTVQPEPVVLCNQLITYAGAVLPPLNPLNLQAVLTSPGSPLLQNIQSLRDKDLDTLNTLYKQSGTTSQRALIDKYALSQTQVRNINQSLLQDLSNITGSSRTDYNIAASVLIRLNVSPVVVMDYSFGGDNHTDIGLAHETSNTGLSVAGIGDLYNRLNGYGVGDDTTLLFLNVFGRSLSTASHANQSDGRSHNADHNVAVIIGSGVKGSVIGGITMNASNTDFRATAFDSATGAVNDAGGDVSYENTLGAMGKTVGMAVGVQQSVLDTQITEGIVVPAALAS